MANIFKITRRQVMLAYPLFISAVAMFFSIAPAAFALQVDQVIHGENPSSGTYLNTTAGQTAFIGGNNLKVNAGTTLRGLNVNGKDGGNFLLKANTVQIKGAVDVSAFYGKNGFEGNGGRVNIDARNVLINGMIKADGINGGFINIPSAGTVNVGPNAVISASGVGGHAGQVMIRGTDGVNLAAGSIVQANGLPVGKMVNVDIAGSIVNINGIVRANGIVSDGGKISIVANGTTPNSNLTIGSNGRVEANGACGDCTHGDGGDAGKIALKADCGSIINNGVVEAKGGNGFGSHITDKHNIPHGNAGNGGNGGYVSMTYGNRLDTKVGHVNVSGGKGGTAIANCEIHTGEPGDGGKVVIKGLDADTLDTSKVAFAGGTAGFPTVIKTGKPGSLTVIAQDASQCSTCGEPPSTPPPPPPVVSTPNPPPPVVSTPTPPPTRPPFIRRLISTLPFLGPNAGLDLMRRRSPEPRFIPPAQIINNVPPIPNAVLVSVPPPQPPVTFVAQPVVPPPVAPTPPPAPKKYVRGYW